SSSGRTLAFQVGSASSILAGGAMHVRRGVRDRVSRSLDTRHLLPSSSGRTPDSQSGSASSILAGSARARLRPVPGHDGLVAELEYALVLGTSAFGHEGSIPSEATTGSPPLRGRVEAPPGCA